MNNCYTTFVQGVAIAQSLQSFLTCGLILTILLNSLKDVIIIYLPIFFAASIPNIGQLVGSLLAGLIANYLGRKRCVLLFTIPLICGWLLLIFYNSADNSFNFWMIIIARILQGFGMLPSISQVYLTEVLDVQRRDTLGEFPIALILP